MGSAEKPRNMNSSYLAPLLAGAAAGISVDVALYPLDTLKTRLQSKQGFQKAGGFRGVYKDAYKAEGFRRGVYRGFLSTVARDLPFSFIELPIWEMLKTMVMQHNEGQINSLQSAACGSLAGGFAAAVTTPLDLAKTRIMLAEEYAVTRKLRIKPVLTSIYAESGLRGLFAGVTPRVSAFMLGGFVFFGVYDDVKAFVQSTQIAH